MSWVVLVLSGVLEAVWAAALSASEGFSRLRPSLLFLAALTLSMGGLAYALRGIPIGTGYAVWVGIGAVGTALYGMVALDDPVSVGRVVCLVLIVAGVVGLKVLE
ncbi:ligand-binding protein SH3 [Streptomyces sp. TRM43335]|uniref:Ligand-binding protein SH3 n=1 Tax=Streptomyces taklimakanensis TaxID=2569853 RepID=A0A6G2B6V7_9ACTN|nr:ligand-binding protein SH3 [Streptomyces taklimakanensis]